MRKPSRGFIADRARAGDDGFSLVEAVIAVFIAAVVFTSAAMLMMGMTITTLTARQNQQAIDLISETVEEFRKQDFAALAMVPSDLSADVTAGVVRQSGTNYFFDPANPTTGAGAGEQIVVRSTGALNPHIREVKRNSTTFTVASYVTDPADPNGEYKRLTVRVTWQIRAKVHERQVTTFIAETRRGLPLPRFILAADGAWATTAGGTVTLPAKLTNRGARDAWNLQLVPSGAGWGAVTWYQDTDGDRTLDVGEPLIPGKTPLLETDQVYDFLAVVTNNGTLGSFDLVITATSDAQPTATTASASITHTGVVTAPVCVPCAQFSTLHLHDEPILVNTGGSPQNLTTGLGHLGDGDRFGDTDTIRGLSVPAGGTVAWRSAAATTPVNFSGTASVTLFAATQGFDRNLRGQLRVRVLRSDGLILGDSGLTPAAGPSGNPPRWGTSDFKAVTIDVILFSGAQFTVGTGQSLILQVSASPSVGMILQYDVPNTHDAFVTFPAVS